MRVVPPLRVFQSTHPLRGATEPVRALTVHGVISIHAPLAGCDWNYGSGSVRFSISIHAPLAGCD